MYSKIITYIYCLAWAVFIIAPNNAFSQCATQINLLNPSFEGTPGNNTLPPFWSSCRQGWQPAIQPYSVNSSGLTMSVPIAPYKGSTYLGLAYNDTFGSQGISQQLSTPMQAAQHYTSSIELAIPSTIDTSYYDSAKGTWDVGSHADCAGIYLFGGDSIADLQQLLWSSGIVTSTIWWQKYNISFTPTQNWAYLSIIISGCNSPDYIFVDTIAPLVPDIIHVTINSSALKICSGDSALICASDTGFTSYEWSNGATTPCMYTKNAGDFYLSVTAQNNCIVESNHISVFVYPNAPISISGEGDTLKVYGAINRQWCLNDTLIPNATDSIYIAQQPGLYTVQMADSNGCRQTSLPTLITGVVGLSAWAWLKVYPNPSVDGNWQLAVSENLIRSMVEIYDDTGRRVYKSEIFNSISNLAPDIADGVYIMKLSSGSMSYTLKLIKLK